MQSLATILVTLLGINSAFAGTRVEFTCVEQGTSESTKLQLQENLLFASYAHIAGYKYTIDKSEFNDAQKRGLEGTWESAYVPLFTRLHQDQKLRTIEISPELLNTGKGAVSVIDHGPEMYRDLYRYQMELGVRKPVTYYCHY
jgi:hypothetical protein